MAGKADPGENQSLERHLNDPRGAEHATIEVPKDRIQEAAAKLYGQGFGRAQVARLMVDFLVPNGKHRPLEQRLSQARTKLRNWEMSQEFRDKIYNLAVVKLDLQTPEILGGIAKKAKRGRVDAARLALEITGRHNPKGEQQPTQVAIVVNGMSRPVAQPIPPEEIVQTIENADEV